MYNRDVQLGWASRRDATTIKTGGQSMNTWLRRGMAIVAALTWANIVCAADSPRRPNVLLIITDDQGYGDLGCHGNKMIQTPQLDALARQSVRLTNFHVDPTCAETRSALMTGRYSCRAGVWHTVMGRSILGRTEYTMAQEFAHHGYRTAMFGKWHLGDNYPYLPHDRGFQETLYHGGGGVGQTPDFWGNDYFDDTFFRNGRPEPQRGYCTDVWFREATRFIEQNKNEEKPFFCYLATNAPHSPYNVEPKYSQPYVERGIPQPMASFYGMIANIDENVGRLLGQLNEWKLADNTIVIFMTDNGSAAGSPQLNASKKKRPAGDWPGFAAGMRGQKGSQYEGGHRVPCFVRWPNGRLQVDRDLKTLAAHFDLLPTLMELCEMNWPADVYFDGTSLAAELRGGKDLEPLDRTLVVHSQRVDQPEKWRKCSVMTSRWRLVDGKELYDLPADPGQETNIASKHLDVVAQLRKFYEGWWQDVSAGPMSQGFDKYASIVLGAKEANPASLNCMDWHADIAQIPWSQSNIAGNPDVESNGFWAVEVARPGRYEFTLRSRPEGVPYVMKAGKARVKVGSVEAVSEIAAGTDSAKIVIELPVGEKKLQTWVKEEGRGERGAFFVDVKRLAEE